MHAITMVLEGKTVEVQQLDEKLTPKQQKLDLHEPEKDELTAKDFEMLRNKKAVKEDAEELDELSKKTLGSYAKKATDAGNTKSSMNLAVTGQRAYSKGFGADGDTIHPADRKANTRSAGVHGAITRLAKEETEIVEDSEELNEALRKISEHGKGMGAYHAEVRYDPEYQEYQSHFYKDGEHMGEGPVGYHGSGKEGKKDAQDTAEHQVKKMNSRAMSEGAYTQHYMDANKPSPVRQAAEIAKAPKQKISFRKDPINAATNAMHDKALDVFQNFGKKKVAEEVSELDELSHDTLQSYKRKTRTKLYNLAAAGPAPEGSKRKAEIDKRVSGYRKAWQKQDDKFYQTEEVSETTFKYNDFEIELDENFSYADYLNAVKTIVNSDDPSIQGEIISIAAEAYDTQDMNVIIEATTMAHAKSVVESLRKADINTTISNPEAVVLEGKPGFKYSKTNNGKTSVTIHTASGVVRKV